MDFLKNDRILGNAPETWITAIAIAAGVAVGLVLLRRILCGRVRWFQERTRLLWPGAVLAVLMSSRKAFFYFVGLYCGFQVLIMSPKPTRIFEGAVFIAFLLQLAIWGTALIRYYVNRDIERKGSGDGAHLQTMKAIGILADFLLYIVLFLWCLSGFGVNITTLVAGLGVGGIAVALAVQNILGDLFASLTIVLDKPFVYGDSIAVDDFRGTIENVGLKTTRVRSETGEQVIFPNANLLQSRIRNMGRMRERRVLFTLNISQESSLEQLKAIPALIKKCIEGKEDVRFDRVHLVLLGPSSFDFEVMYWMEDPDGLKHLNRQQAILLDIMAALRGHGIAFASPTRTLFFKDPLPMRGPNDDSRDSKKV